MDLQLEFKDIELTIEESENQTHILLEPQVSNLELVFPNTLVLNNSALTLPKRVINSNTNLDSGYSYIVRSNTLLQLNLPAFPGEGDVLEIFTDSTGLYKLYSNIPISLNRENSTNYIESQNMGDFIRVAFYQNKWVAVYFSGWFDVN